MRAHTRRQLRLKETARKPKSNNFHASRESMSINTRLMSTKAGPCIVQAVTTVAEAEHDLAYRPG
jgi:hypothetical protein